MNITACTKLASATHLTRNRQNDLQYIDDDPHEYPFHRIKIDKPLINIDYRVHLDLMADNFTAQSLVRQLLTGTSNVTNSYKQQ